MFNIHVSNLIVIDFLMLINSQLTTMAHTVLPLNHCKYKNVRSCQSRTFKGLGETANVECFNRHKYWVDKMSYFQAEMKILGFFGVLTD